jgi:imidazolonepropionase-like amidohydrolase
MPASDAVSTAARSSSKESCAARASSLSGDRIAPVAITLMTPAPRSTAHAHAVEGIRAAVEAGVTSIEHGTLADDDVLREMARLGVFLVATLGAVQDEQSAPPDMPEHIRRRFDEVRSIHLEAVRDAYRLGVPLAMGTDAGAPGDHHRANARECVRLVRDVGLSPAEAIDAATVNAAKLLRLDAGDLRAGMLADVIAVPDDPLQDITALQRVRFVMAAGRVVMAAHTG